MDVLLYKIREKEGKTLYTIRTIHTYLFSVGLLIIFAGYMMSVGLIAYLGVFFVVFHLIAKLLGAGTTRKLLQLHKEERLTAIGSKYSFRNPLTFIDHGSKVS